jgi:hypothetical protein
MSATVLLNQASVMQTANGNTSDIIWSGYTELAVDALVTNQQGTAPTLQLLLDRKDAANNYEPIWQSSVTSVSTASTTNVPISSSIGVGLAIAQSFAATGRIRWIIGGSATPGATFNVSLIAK